MIALDNPIWVGEIEAAYREQQITSYQVIKYDLGVDIYIYIFDK